MNTTANLRRTLLALKSDLADAIGLLDEGMADAHPQIATRVLEAAEHLQDALSLMANNAAPAV